MYITIEGVIGVGKTSLTDLVSHILEAETIYEIVEDNPLLDRFYQNPQKWALHTEMFFLTDRYNQLKAIEKIKQEKDIVSDYNIFKNLIFAKETLSSDEYKKFETIFHILMKDFRKSDLIIILLATEETIFERILKRNRFYEQDIDREYIRNLIKAYNMFIENELKKSEKNYLIIDGDEYDFVNNEEDKKKISRIIKNEIKEINAK